MVVVVAGVRDEVISDEAAASICFRCLHFSHCPCVRANSARKNSHDMRARPLSAALDRYLLNGSALRRPVEQRLPVPASGVVAEA